MALIKKLDYDEEDKKPKKKTKKKKSSRKKSTKKGNEGLSLTTIAVIVVFVVLLGATIVYVSGQVNKIQEGGDEKAQLLEAQVESLKNELKTLRDTAHQLEKQSETNKEIVIDLFDRNREIPEGVDTSGWSVYTDDTLAYEVKYPDSWEVVPGSTGNTNPFEPTSDDDATETADDQSADEEEPTETASVVYLQPADQSDFTRAVTIKNDYLNFSELDLEEKYDIFSGLDLLDERDFAQGKMLYFIDVGDKNQTIPTILILTDDRIFRATFDVTDKALENYIAFRKDFEEIISTFGLVTTEPSTDEATE